MGKENWRGFHHLWHHLFRIHESRMGRAQAEEGNGENTQSKYYLPFCQTLYLPLNSPDVSQICRSIHIHLYTYDGALYISCCGMIGLDLPNEIRFYPRPDV